MNRFADLLQSTEEKQQEVLVGIIVDVSNSMKRNWRNKDGKKLPRIEIIRDSLNRFLQEEQQKRATDGQTLEQFEVFCLGMGFQIPTEQTEVQLSYEQEHSLGTGTQKRTQVDIVCDLLALSSILPTQKEMDEFKELLNQKWQSCSKDIMEQSVISDDASTQLITYIQQGFHQSALEHFHRSLSYRLARTTLARWLWGDPEEKIREREVTIATLSQKASKEYADHVYQKAMEDITKNQPRYVSMIENHLLAFAQSYTSSVLRALTLGFTTTELVDDLDEKQAIEQAKLIQKDLESDVRRHIGLQMVLHEQRLANDGRQIAASLDKKEVRRLTERLIRKSGWDTLRPFVEKTVLTIFLDQFQKQAKESFPYWITLASTREMTRSLSRLKNVLPEVVKEQVYTDDIMFGSTPFRQAIDKAAMRLIDPQHQDKKKILLIISDGEFEEIFSSMITVNLLKRRGVSIISCVVGDRNILSQLVKYATHSQPLGTRLMIEIASQASELKDEGLEWKEGKTVRRLKEEKLCFQINHSHLLENILEVVFQRE